MARLDAVWRVPCASWAEPGGGPARLVHYTTAGRVHPLGGAGYLRRRTYRYTHPRRTRRLAAARKPLRVGVACIRTKLRPLYLRTQLRCLRRSESGDAACP